MFWVSAGLSVADRGARLVRCRREVRPEVDPGGRVLDLAYGAVRGVLADPAVRRIFAIYGVAFLANQMSRPYQPLIVEQLVGTGPGLASAIGFVVGTAALAGAVTSPLGGLLGDRFGFRPVLIGALLGGAAALCRRDRRAAAIPALALAVPRLHAPFNGIVGAMVFSLLATEVPAERRSADAQPRLSAALRGRHRRPGDRGRCRRGRAGSTVRSWSVPRCSWSARWSSPCGSGRGWSRPPPVPPAAG